ncbi:hypothetical protein LEMLEM_LOCUS1998, partial [Lemmus lemmus]
CTGPRKTGVLGGGNRKEGERQKWQAQPFKGFPAHAQGGKDVPTSDVDDRKCYRDAGAGDPEVQPCE